MGPGQRIVACVTIFCLVIFVLPLSITSVVLGCTRPGSCDNTDIMGIDVGQYLLGSGISSIFVCVVMIILCILLLCDRDSGLIGSIMVVFSLVCAMFGFAWFIIGSVVLFRGNIECIREKSTHVIYALVLWCISAFHIINNCCNVRSKENTHVSIP